MLDKVALAELTQKRRVAVAGFAGSNKQPSEIASELRKQGIVNPHTGKAYSRQTIRADMRAVQKPTDVRQLANGIRTFRRPLAETIGQWSFVKPVWFARILLNVDSTWKDYVFLDALRRGTAPGYEIGGLFCTPIAQTIASHVLGDGISASLMDSGIPAKELKFSLNEAAIAELGISEADGKPTRNLKNAQSPSLRKPAANGKNGNAPGAPSNGNGKMPIQIAPPPPPRAKPNPDADSPVAWTNAQIKRFLERYQGFIQQVTVDKYCFGNQFVVVNPDATLAVISPETVTVQYSASDYRRPIRYIIRTKMEKCRVEDIYEADKRTVKYHYYDERGTVTEEYENLIGRIPIVHFVCDRSANEIYGRPIYEAAIPLMRNYDDLMFNMTEGVKVIGNPIPTFEGLDNPEASKQLNSEQVNYTDENGNIQTQWVTRFDRNAGLWLGRGANSKMLSPQVGFTKDALDVLRQYFLLLLNHTRIPEFVWGGAINSSKASAETQLPPFLQYIKFRRLEMQGEGADPALGIEAAGGLLELLDIWLRTYKLLNPAIVVGPVRVEWPAIDLEDNLLKYQWGTFLAGLNKISDEDLIAMPGYWSNPAEIVARAAGKKQRPPQFDQYEKNLRQARLQAAQGGLIPPPVDEEGQPFSTDYVTPDFADGLNSPTPPNTPDPYNPFGPLFWQHQFSGFS